MSSRLQLGEFYGATRKHVEVAAFAFAEVEDYIDSRVPRHTHEHAHFLYVVTHVGVFAAGYLLIEDLGHGWLVLNVWHNAQYVLTVWLFNNNRFKDEVDTRHRFLSTLSRRKNFVFYILF